MKSLLLMLHLKEEYWDSKKVRTRDKIKKVHDWMGYDIAFVEGSDPKTIEEIGKGDKKNYIKIGEASYGAVKICSYGL